MAKILHCCYNVDTNCVELTFDNGGLLSIDCEELENVYDITNHQMADLDWLLNNGPVGPFRGDGGFFSRCTVISLDARIPVQNFFSTSGSSLTIFSPSFIWFLLTLVFQAKVYLPALASIFVL